MTVAFENVKKIYSFLTNTIPVIDNLSFEIEKGDFLVITGPSGSGKTTILRIMAGLAPVTTGTVRVANTAFSETTQEELALLRSAYIGIVFQDFQLIQTLTCLENVMLPLELAGETSKKAFEEAKVQLANVGLGHRLNHYPLQLSGGEQQRVAWARAFMNHPDILIADEPTANLDYVTQKFLFSKLTELRNDPEITVVISTHEKEIQTLATCTLAFDAELNQFIFKRLTDLTFENNVNEIQQ
jgi:putative ABC transport system ATP-binding protein